MQDLEETAEWFYILPVLTLLVRRLVVHIWRISCGDATDFTPINKACYVGVTYDRHSSASLTSVIYIIDTYSKLWHKCSSKIPLFVGMISYVLTQMIPFDELAGSDNADQ